MCGQLRSQVVCSTCDSLSTAFDPFWDLSVPIPSRAQTSERASSAIRSAAGGCGSSSACSLTECMSAFSAEETLAEDDAYYCSKCKTHQPARKKLALYRVPHLLIIHIKRFRFSTFRRTKLGTSVTGASELDIRPYCAEGATLVDLPTAVIDPSCPVDGGVGSGAEEGTEEGVGGEGGQQSPGAPEEKGDDGDDGDDGERGAAGGVAPRLVSEAGEDDTMYDLVGVSNHMGALGGGHYTADCMNGDGQSWHNFNDSRVSPLGEVRGAGGGKGKAGEGGECPINGANAYLLFFRRRSDYKKHQCAAFPATGKRHDTSAEQAAGGSG